MTSHALTGISSMATRHVLAAMAQQWSIESGVRVQIESVGGVDAAQRVAAGESMDLVFLAQDPLTTLQQSGHVVAGSLTPLMRSGVAVAVAQGAVVPAIANEAELKQAIQDARAIGYSTGPSGHAFLALLQRWGLLENLRHRLVQAPPGVAVATLISSGQVTLGLQQWSELLDAPGIAIVGLMPSEVAIETVFCGAIARTCTDPSRLTLGRQLLAFMASSLTEPIRQAYGMKAA